MAAPEPKGREKLLLEKKTVTLRTVAERVGLAPCSISAILNNTPASWAIPQRTKDRVFRAAAQLDYRPNLSARSLRTKRTHMVAVVSPDFGQPSVARAIAGMERSLRRKGYLLILATFDGDSDWTRISVELQQRGIEGVIAVGMSQPRDVEMPVVSLDLGHYAAREPLAEEVSGWLNELGESAVEAMLRMIETKATPRKATIVPKFPPAFVNFHPSAFEEVRDVS
jgi:transcriptional regulator with XRE-family HTH domain